MWNQRLASSLNCNHANRASFDRSTDLLYFQVLSREKNDDSFVQRLSELC
jgi:hypothetical protein